MVKTQSHKPIVSKQLLFFVLSALLFFMLLSAVYSIGTKYFAMRKKLSEATDEQQVLVQKKKTLETENSYYTTIEGQEHLLRDKYNLVKPGEGVIIITTPKSFDASKNTSKKGIAAFWDTLLRALGHTEIMTVQPWYTVNIQS